MFQCSQSSRGWWNSQNAIDFLHSGCVSVLSVEPWLVEPEWLARLERDHPCFSALSRAVVGGTIKRELPPYVKMSFSALSRAVVGGTYRRIFGDD